MSEHHIIRFAPGTVVSPGEYRNCTTGVVRYFDGKTPLPGSTNSSAWQQVSDHYHAQDDKAAGRRNMPDSVSRGVRFPPGTVVSPGEYRNCDTGAVRYFDGKSPLPGSVNSASWQQISDHYHAQSR